jgi:hypothetical protein
MQLSELTKSKCSLVDLSEIKPWES